MIEARVGVNRLQAVADAVIGGENGAHLRGEPLGLAARGFRRNVLGVRVKHRQRADRVAQHDHRDPHYPACCAGW